MRKQSQLVPENTVSGNALTIVVAIMCFLACLTLGAVTLVRDAASDWQTDLLREVTIQVRPIEGVDTAAEAAKAATVARLFRGVASAEVISEAESTALLEPWLGTGLDLGELPIPRLIVVRLSDPSIVDLGALADRLAAQVRGATLDDHRGWTSRLQTMARVTVFIGLGILSLVFMATVLSVVFATRGAMAGKRDVVSVVHFVGAEGGFIAREYQRHFMLLGLKGGLMGAAAAAFIFALTSFVLAPSMSPVAADQSAALFGSFAVGPVGYLGALAIAFMIAVMTAITSRLTVYRYLAESE
ncbi:MAG: ABC transporter permease [Bauldia litoralis]|uniref:cell division protein FtsX n=1 Tax=Bauldia litoralis TaxID=665467 RepID=UPI00329758B0